MDAKIVQGNAVDALLSHEITVLLHVANCKGVMGSGIAKEIKDRVPAAFAAYKHHEQYKGLKLGSISSANGVYNLHAQDNYGRGERHLNYGALYEALVTAQSKFPAHWDSAPVVVGVPFKMGSDRAGGDWEVVKELVEWAMYPYPVTYYKL